jgi:hypothetical protein
MIKTLVTAFALQICFIAIANGQFTKSVFMFGDVTMTIQIHKNLKGNGLELEMVTQYIWVHLNH